MRENIRLALFGAGCTKEYAEKQSKELLSEIGRIIDGWASDPKKGDFGMLNKNNIKQLKTMLDAEDKEVVQNE